MENHEPYILVNGAQCRMMADKRVLDIWLENIQISAHSDDLMLFHLFNDTLEKNSPYILQAGNARISLTRKEAKTIATTFCLEVMSAY
ncbi:hypothetical protein [Vibrio sp. WXL210]|uniref:hypothetical protein n=1 Tax=Vibrio sp. WXL210 TaxID=3450709 RepID=UPI003EC53363